MKYIVYDDTEMNNNSSVSFQIRDTFAEACALALVYIGTSGIAVIKELR